MRSIHLVQLDKTRPALILTRERARDAMSKVTVAPITSTARGLSTEVAVGPSNGLEAECVVSCDNVLTIPTVNVGRFVGMLHESQEAALAKALINAFDLRVEDLG